MFASRAKMGMQHKRICAARRNRLPVTCGSLRCDLHSLGPRVEPARSGAVLHRLELDRLGQPVSMTGSLSPGIRLDLPVGASSSPPILRR